MDKGIKVFVSFIIYCLFSAIYSTLKQECLLWLTFAAGFLSIIALAQFIFLNIRVFKDSSIRSMFKSVLISFTKSKNKSDNLS
jgi:hypothetical protein